MKNEITEISIDPITGRTYILLIHLCQPQYLLIGKLGWNLFNEGTYLYVGSAKKWIDRRLKRHLRRDKNQFWHIDYLLSDPVPSVIKEIWIHQNPCECSVARLLAQSEFCKPVQRGFGSSDCQCISHLFYISRKDIDKFCQLLAHLKFFSIGKRTDRKDSITQDR